MPCITSSRGGSKWAEETRRMSTAHGWVRFSSLGQKSPEYEASLSVWDNPAAAAAMDGHFFARIYVWWRRNFLRACRVKLWRHPNSKKFLRRRLILKRWRSCALSLFWWSHEKGTLRVSGKSHIWAFAERRREARLRLVSAVIKAISAT